MSKAGVVGALKVERQHAAIVGELIENRTSGDDLADTPLFELPSFGRKLVAAAKRKRAGGGVTITIWRVERNEATHGFHYLALFYHPGVPDGLLTKDEDIAVRSVLASVTVAITAQRGRKNLSREQAEAKVRAWTGPPEVDTALGEPGDERHARRLQKRVKKEDALRATPVAHMPERVLRLLLPKYRQ